MRILGKGGTAKAVLAHFADALLYDDTNKDDFDINSTEQTVVSPGIPPHNYLVQNTKNLISDYDLFLKPNDFSVWISGTNGKTTTTSMITHLLGEDKAISTGNIGLALGEAIQYKDEKTLIIESSSFTLHYTNKAKPNIYLLLPITQDHISWHGSFEAYEDAKLSPLKRMTVNDVAILPYKYKDIQTKCKVYFYKNSEDIANQFNIDTSKINFKEPFLMDAVLALCVNIIITNKLDYEKINNYAKQEHKLEEFHDKDGNLWVNDSKATNIDATIQALKCYEDDNILLILGGDSKGANQDELFELMKNKNITIFAIGSNTNQTIIDANKYNINSIKCSNLDIAVLKMKEMIKNNNNIKYTSMLSPAAASLDQFVSYTKRGLTYKELVCLS